MLENARSKRNMLDFNFEKNMLKKLLDIFEHKYIFTIRLSRIRKFVLQELFSYTGWPKSRYTVIKLFFMCFEVTSSALYVAQK